MTNRICKHVVEFAYPFTLSGIEGVFPQGAYVVEIEEEPVEGEAFRSHRAIGSILVRRQPGQRAPQFWDIELASLGSALERDATLIRERAGRTAAPILLPMDRTVESIDRAENEGWSPRCA